ncbi:MAG: 2-succinyl-5-enolpyruvyl-6-hydroxy-3-cyclohexene-1-carboxylic-acid synthase [Microbacteriaceae bacterium]|nr:2-succinyl-5-enolpyruvyl-6-hydroxy-3-cyclohexene-1-carboxylic-acid synthase [Microbacteriaceae bacterium]
MVDSPAQVFAAHLMANFAAWGRPVWLAPGARSQALAIASAQLADAGELELFVRLDERSLGFSALGASVYGGPQIIITTSGTAVANLHPAVLEAHHSGLPLILLTADRPVELRGKGSNQTTNQIGIFNDAVHCIDVEAPTADESLAEKAKALVEEAVLEAWSGKVVQLNLQFREPLSANTPDAVEILQSLNLQVPEANETSVVVDPEVIDLSVPTVVVAGANSGSFEEEIAALGVPVLAEPTSGVRHVLGYRFVLDQDSELTINIKQVIVYGKPTLSRPVIALLKREDVQVIVRPSRMGHFGIGTNIKQVDSPLVGEGSDGSWLESWQARAKELTPAASGSLDRRAIIETIWGLGRDLVLGASQLIREADFYAPGNRVRAWANRGLAGIDGTIATATGIALQTGSPVTALMGDLTFFHDASSLVIDELDGPVNLQIVVVNDRGGKIFSKLEVAQSVSSEIFTRVFATPQSGSIEGLAKAYGWEYRSVSSKSELDNALTVSGRVVIEIALS